MKINRVSTSQLIALQKLTRKLEILRKFNYSNKQYNSITV